MNANDESQAPWSHPQKEAAFGFPLMLVIGALAVHSAVAGSYQWPDWAVPVILAIAIIGSVAMIVAPLRTEAPDERDRLIVLKATRRAYVFLVAVIFVAFGTSLVFVPGVPAWDVEKLAVGAALLSQAVYFGTILLLYRHGTED